MKTTVSISVDSRLMRLVRASGVNVSKTCEKALSDLVGFRDARALAARIDELKREIEVLSSTFVHTKSLDERVQVMRRLYENRHSSNPDLTEQQDLTWLRTVKGLYGLEDMQEEELLWQLMKEEDNETTTD